MSLPRQKITKRASLLLALCLLFVCASVSFAGPLVGKLRTRGKKPIVVNGINVNSGMAIFSGVEIQSLEGVGATVELGALGRLDMAPDTDVTLTFSEENVMAELKSGCVVLTTKKGIKGSVKTLEGLAQADPSKLSRVTACTPGKEIGSGIGAGGGGMGTGGAVGIGAAYAGAIGGAAATAGRDNGRGKAISPSTPNR